MSPETIVAIGGAVGAAVAAGFGGIKAILMVAQKLSNGHGNPSAYITAQTSVLQAISEHLGTMTERMSHLPTKDDIRQFAEQNRHAAAGLGDRVQKAVEEKVDGSCEAADTRDLALHRRLDALPDLVAARIR